MITGITAVRSTRIQAQSQRESERVAREHGQQDKHKELRRAAYTELLQAVSELNDCCMRILSLTAHNHNNELSDALSAARETASALSRRTIVVTLEGPPSVAAKAGKCSTDGLAYFRAILDIYESSNAPPSDATIADLVGDRCDQQSATANMSHAAFVRAAREVLGGHT
ncbi:hypothetical protein [Streptomyces europaeiscabiei]|uniref:hypothetical protein n=1 Tax=Streptomyces europaeiscabiei TaxID=146819 RepID=UPI0029B69650|nr:hypothetical protein [Streptomyces europaeiscabiei]MDX3839402.1 hypothetical protein [Streptomyces europaeiscabiei]